MKRTDDTANHASNNSEVKKSVPWIYYVIFFAVLNESVFNVSTPDIARQFDLDASGVSWVVTIFFIVFGMGMVIFGKLSDMYSVKKLITIGIVLYSIGSVLGFVLQSWYPAVILSRAIQGAGGSAIPALVFVMVARFFTAAERGKLFGIITSTVSFAIGIGPLLGGYIASTFHWSYLFLVSLPVLIAIPFFQKFLPEEPRRAGKMDIVGAVLLGLAISMIILFTTEVQWLYLFIAVLALLLFIVHIRRAKDPFVDPALFVDPLYRIGLIIGFFIFGTVMSIVFVIPLMFHHIYHLNPKAIGLLMFPGAMSAVIFGRVAGHLTVKRGSHFVVYTGLTLIAVSLLFQSSVIGMWVWYIGVALVLMYIGFSFMQTALAESMTQILPVDRIGVGMGLFNMTSTLSGAVVTALVAKAIEQKLLAFPFHPLLTSSHTFLYGNLILLLSMVVVASALMYFFTFGKKAPQPVKEPI
ncbi:MFS transporter [Desmospora activa]|uniref:DHA2 family metal-tetracycline-proton antiporter-like MFS transporter n=1 Tax=Desmospora activa DSM 45169 TaxID=1121389 RepID=A0A2T4ZCP3_9BACL|nr:MFS transporter [Desmospora activa]PTM59653.1 DHA2 family metal-tetracycline-proton antiporter-like MFS transporter [Desmospora activa DSM 45169]